ncbi:RICIN domain-containing protein [Saccharothrix xinjiangensis]|uniref:Ricin-type beta-trefoil lectin domain protein n=1 Tax=Saccharothrix xinjiangensis TaxID=204798 RepID=A0ABV9XWV3_9PSEU
MNVGSNGSCLDLSSYASGTPATLYPCYSAPSQQWVLTAAGKIRNVGGDECLDLQSYATGTPAVVHTCYSTPSQVWDGV